MKHQGIIIIIVLSMFICLSLYASSLSPKNSATPCAARNLKAEQPFIIYFELTSSATNVVKIVMKEFPDAIVEMTGVKNGDTVSFVAKIFVPNSQRKKFQEYLAATDTNFVSELSLKKEKIITDKKDPDYSKVMGKN